MTAAESAYRTSSTHECSQDELILQELPQVYYIATRIRERLPQHVELDDLVSAGVVGLIEATRNFDNSKNVPFKSYAKFRIRGSILDSLRETDWGSRYMRRKGREIADASARLEGTLGRCPLESEIADELHLDQDHLRRIRAQLESLQICGQKVAANNDRSESLDVIESAPNLDDPDPFDLCLTGEINAHLAEAISKLTEREQLILSLYYREELTLKEISKVVGVALSRVSQIRQATVAKLKHSLNFLEGSRSPQRALRGGCFEHAYF